MINGYCEIGGSLGVNLNEVKKYEWPKQFVAVPRVGEQVEANFGEGLYLVLTVSSVTHVMVTNPENVNGKMIPGIRVDLNLE